jgi:hypothetical protein
MLAAHTLSVNINCPPGEVYEFLVNPQNLPQWAGGLCQSVSQGDAGWLVQTPQGAMQIRFAEKNIFGVLDHYVSPAPGVEIYVPMRVLPNAGGSTLVFTLMRQPEMSDADYARDMQLVEQDLRKLKELLEN